MGEKTVEHCISLLHTVGGLMIIKNAFSTLIKLLLQPQQYQQSQQSQQLLPRLGGIDPSITNEKYIKKDIPYYKKISDIKWKLCGKRVTFEEAHDILHMIPGSYADGIFDRLHIYDEIYHILDLSRDTVSSEYIVFRHPIRRWVAYYQVVPFLFDANLSYTACKEDSFWYITGLNNMLSERYNELRAAKKIQQNLVSWLDKPVTKDGKSGIRVQLGWKNLVAEETGIESLNH